MFICTIIHIFICLIGKDCSHFQLLIIWYRIVHLPELIIILSKGLNLIHCEQCCINILSLWMHMLFMMLKDMLCNASNTLIIMVQRFHVDFMTLAVFRVIQLFRVNTLYSKIPCKDGTLILYRESKHVTVCNRILNHVFMQA